MRIRLFVLAAGLWAGSAWAEDWPRWRGPGLNGISNETNWTANWPKEGPQVLWRANVGLGYSSVVVSQGRLYTLGNRNDTDTVFGFDAESGRRLWEHSYSCATNPRYYQGGTSGTPTVDGERVFTLSREGHLFCFNAADGTVLWSRQIAKELKLEVPEWGFAGSPFVLGELLILNAGTHGIALRKADGGTLWQSGPKASGYSTPVPFDVAGRAAVLVFAAKALVAVDVRNGESLWEYPWKTEYDVNAADPVVAGEYLFVSSGYRTGGALLSAGRGRPVQVWKNQNMHNQLNSSVCIKGHLYGVSGQNGYSGELRCVDFRSGELLWSEKSTGLGALMAAGERLIVLGEKGELIIAEAEPAAFKPLARAQILGGTSWTAPVLANGRIYCRNSRGDLACVDVRIPASTEGQ